MGIYNSIHSEDIRELFRNNYTYLQFEENPSEPQYVWDLISAAIAIDSGIISEYRDVRLDVDDSPSSPTYEFWNTVTSRLSKHFLKYH